MKPWIDERVTSYIVSLQDVVPEMEAFRKREERRYTPIIHREVEALISWLIRIKGIRKILELGTATGYSATAFALADRRVAVTTIEKDRDRFDLARRHFIKMGVADRVTGIWADALEAMEDLEGPFDLLFIDAGKSHYQAFLEKALPLLSEDALIICDNVLYGGRVVLEWTEHRHRTSTNKMKAFLERLSAPPYDTVLLPIGDGLSLSRLGQPEEDDEKD